MTIKPTEPDKLIEEVEALLAKATPGLWVPSGNGIHVGIHAVATTHAADTWQRQADARLIAAAPELLRRLVEEVKTLRSDLQTAELTVEGLLKEIGFRNKDNDDHD